MMELLDNINDAFSEAKDGTVWLQVVCSRPGQPIFGPGFYI